MMGKGLPVVIVKLRSQASAASHIIVGWIEHRTGVFDDVRKVPGAVGRIHRGIRTVPVGQIGGSVGRCSEFDSDFMPANVSAAERWKHVDRAFHRGKELPPVSLYKVGAFYFVLDGHHRLSVASYQGVEWIDAEVTEFGAGLWRGQGMKAS